MKTWDLNLLRALDALLATGSVTAAAERLHLSVAATSHTLARAREAMGDPLFVRARPRRASASSMGEGSPCRGVTATWVAAR